MNIAGYIIASSLMTAGSITAFSEPEETPLWLKISSIVTGLISGTGVLLSMHDSSSPLLRCTGMFMILTGSFWLTGVHQRITSRGPINVYEKLSLIAGFFTVTLLETEVLLSTLDFK